MCEYCRVSKDGECDSTPILEQTEDFKCDINFADESINFSLCVPLNIIIGVYGGGESPSLCVGVYDEEEEFIDYSKDFSINFCPMCGRKLKKI